MVGSGVVSELRDDDAGDERIVENNGPVESNKSAGYLKVIVPFYTLGNYVFYIE